MWMFSAAFLYSVASCTGTQQENGLCTQVNLMSQYCTDADFASNDDEGVGIPGPRGRPGERGLPGFVNYSKVGEEMETKIKEIEESFEAKITKYEIVMNRTVTELKKKLDVLTTTDCSEVKMRNVKERSGRGGVFDIYRGTEIEVFCDLTTDGGGWTVFQRRINDDQKFDKGWRAYVEGFGNLASDFWLGLEKLHLLTQGGVYELQIELLKQNNKVGIAKYETFSVSGSSQNYKLTVGGFSGMGLDDSLSYHNGMAFSTKDRDNDGWGTDNCAAHLNGGWWFNNCHFSSLNGDYWKNEQVYGGTLGIFWSPFTSIWKTEMKFRKRE